MLHLYMKRGRKTLKKIIDLFVFYWFHRCYMERTYLSKCPVFFFFESNVIIFCASQTDLSKVFNYLDRKLLSMQN